MHLVESLRCVPRCRALRTDEFVGRRCHSRPECIRSIRTIECGAPRSIASCPHSCVRSPALHLNAFAPGYPNSRLVEIAIVSPDSGRVFVPHRASSRPLSCIHLVALPHLLSQVLNPLYWTLYAPLIRLSNSSPKNLRYHLIRPRHSAILDLAVSKATIPSMPRLCRMPATDPDHPPTILDRTHRRPEWTPSHERARGFV